MRHATLHPTPSPYCILGDSQHVTSSSRNRVSGLGFQALKPLERVGFQSLEQSERFGFEAHRAPVAYLI
jgi:hypothetical protein